MKIAAGCFGCLAFIFFVLIWVTGPLLGVLASQSPEAASAIGPVASYIVYVDYGCCCLSALLSIVFLAVGMMGGNKDGIQ
jgi:hypothetical protein